MERVGMIGAGAMGLALLERLKLAGVRATVYDSHPPALEAARAGLRDRTERSRCRETVDAYRRRRTHG